MVRFLLFTIFLSLLGCVEENKNCPSVYFSGEIVNPTSDAVVLYRNDLVIDSTELDANNRFSFELSGIDEGLYHFDHSPELQYVYFEEGDSIRIRLNTVEFDESLVFSGQGSELNNFLIEMFLLHEDEEPLMYAYYSLKPEAFSLKIDSLRDIKLDEMNALFAEADLSENAMMIAKAAVDYDTYIHKEKYPFYHRKKTGEKGIHDYGAAFNAHRNILDINNSDLAYFKPYYDYLSYHFGNLSYMTCAKNCEVGTLTHDEHKLHLNRHNMKLIDSLVKVKELKNNLMRTVAVEYLLKVHQANTGCQEFIKEFNALSSNDYHKQEIKDLYEGIKSLQPNNEIPNLEIFDTDGNKHHLRDITRNHKTVFYFWTGTQKKHFKNLSKRIAKLKAKRPEYNFVGINLNTSHSQWIALIEENDLDKNLQFRGGDFQKIQHTLVIDGLNKCVIAKDTLIVDAFANLYASSF
ncbi:MAG: transaldolase [Bacteroidota bacterium]